MIMYLLYFDRQVIDRQTYFLRNMLSEINQ